MAEAPPEVARARTEEGMAGPEGPETFRKLFEILMVLFVSDAFLLE
jgi:hypothetical protein